MKTNNNNNNKEQELLFKVFKYKNKKVSPGEIFDILGIGPKGGFLGFLTFTSDYRVWIESDYAHALTRLIKKGVVKYKRVRNGNVYYWRT